MGLQLPWCLEKEPAKRSATRKAEQEKTLVGTGIVTWTLRRKTCKRAFRRPGGLGGRESHRANLRLRRRRHRYKHRAPRRGCGHKRLLCSRPRNLERRPLQIRLLLLSPMLAPLRRHHPGHFH